MNTAQTNIAKLPDQCFGVLQSSNEIIVIRAGESGYYQPKSQPRKFASYAEASKYVDELNDEDGISKGVREAMESGSMFGWEIPAADKDRYNADGSFKHERKAA